MKPYELGILGGMGSFATATFFQRIVKNTKANKDQEHIDTIVLNHATLPDRTETILENTPQRFLSAIESDLKLLEPLVNHIAIPCNTSHYYFEEMQKMSNVPILNMVNLSVEHIKMSNAKNSKVAVLATDGTIHSKVYENELNKYGLAYEPISIEFQNKVMDIIYQFKSNYNQSSDDINDIIRILIKEENYDSVILACTELSCLTIEEDLKSFTVDALNMLVQESIKVSTN